MSSQLIYKKLGDIQRAIDSIGKTKRNEQQGFMFRGIEHIYNELHPILADHGVFTTSKITNAIREERQSRNGGLLIYSILDVEYTFWAEDGSSVTTQVRGEGMDSADKASNKAMAVAHKYAFTQTFTIPYEGMSDPDAESPKPVDKLTEEVNMAISRLAHVTNADDMQDLLAITNVMVQKDPRFRKAAGAHMKKHGIELAKKEVADGSK